MTFVFDVKKISNGVYSAKIVDIEDKIADAVSEFAKYFEELKWEGEGGFSNTLDWIASYKKIDTTWTELELYVGKVFDEKFPNDPLDIKQNVVNEFLEKYCCDKDIRKKFEAREVEKREREAQEGRKEGGGRKRKKTKKRKHKRKKKTRRRKK